ncbi:MAG: hypothetical protein OET79_07180 [Nitrospirota bacterium]|nr:hypothetical protein [Nitrospirota bacterium]
MTALPTFVVRGEPALAEPHFRLCRERVGKIQRQSGEPCSCDDSWSDPDRSPTGACKIIRMTVVALSPHEARGR